MKALAFSFIVKLHVSLIAWTIKLISLDTG